MRQFLRITKALADETRLRIILGLQAGELCVCQITELLQLAPSTISRHLYLLAQAGLIEKRKTGKWVFYRLAEADASTDVKASIELTIRALAKANRIRQDAALLKDIKERQLEENC